MDAAAAAAMVLEELRRRNEALSSHDRAIALAPDDPAAWTARGALLLRLGRTVEALTSFDRALAARPGYVDALVNRGDAFRTLGQPEQALANYSRCLATKPNDARLISRCGVALAALGRQREALAHHNRATRLAPNDAEVHCARGITLSQLGLPAMALAAFARAVSLRPDYAEAFARNAEVLAALGRHEEAVDSYDRALACDPTLIVALHGRSRALAVAGQPEAALETYDRVLAADPDFVQALIGKGNVLSRLERYEEALDCYDRALQASPDLDEAQTRRVDTLSALSRLSFAEAHCFRADTLRAIDQYTDAIEAYDRAIALCPDYVDAWNGRGLALVELGELADALASYDRAAAIRPDSAGTHANRSTALRNLGRLEEAAAAADRALALDPRHVAALNNRGNALRALGRLGEAVGFYDQAIAGDPQNVQSHFNRALCRLSAGDFARGWEEYEWRTRLPGFAKDAPRLRLPLWLGEDDIAGRTIMLHAEQGYGDTIQFCRYVPLVAARGAVVVLAVQPLLEPLLAGLSGVSRIVGPGERSLALDLRCSLLSLPHAFGTLLSTIPAELPYLAPPPANLRLWQEKLGERRGPRIGIAWSGNLRHKSDRDRSLMLAELAPIAAVGLPLYCLQREMRPNDLPDFAMFANVEYFGDALRDFADTAALIAQMDLVIAVDTAVAHLAGAMGKPVWVMLPHAPDWRWMLERDDSPWYPTMRLFRQPRPGDWRPVVERVRRQLRNLVPA
jgi:tetratricopeptide (TPR) repeat protein